MTAPAASFTAVTPPTVAKLAVDRNDPDAWSLAELARLVAATETFLPHMSAGGVPYPQLFRAVVLVGFHTALRRRSLASLGRADVDLRTGVLSVKGANVKTRRGRKYLLPPYVVEAVREIWDPPRELLFPLSIERLGKQFGKLVAHAGLAPSDHSLPLLHKLRRSASTHAMIAGGMHAATELLDHSSKYITERYIDPTKIPAKAAGAKLPAIGGAAGKLAEARDLFAAGKYHLAAWAARIVLDQRVSEHFRRLQTKRPKSLAEAVKRLAARGVLSPSDARLLARAAKIANRAAHGRDVAKRGVSELIHVVAQFAGDFPEGPSQERTAS